MQYLGDISRKFNIIYFGDHWDEYLRRRQQIAMRLSGFEDVSKIVYIETPLTVLSFFKFFAGQSLSKVTQAWKRVLKHGLLSKENGVWILTPITLLPYMPIKVVQGINSFVTYWIQLLVLKFYIRKLNLRDIILWASHPFAADFIGKLGENMVCYDRTEDFAYKHDCPLMLQSLMEKNDSKIIKRADLIFVQTKEMLEKFSAQKKDVFLIPNAVDIQWFYNDEIADTFDMREIPHPILGYCGNVNSRIDFELLRYVASKHPEWSLVIIGHSASGVDGFSLLKDFKNVHLLGVKPYRELPAYLKQFDVCLMPHKIDRFTESQSPLKLFDYLAAGKPVVSTNIAGVRDYKNTVKIAYTKEDLVFLIEEALVNNSEEEVRKRQIIAQQNSWDQRIRQIFQVLKPYLERIQKMKPRMAYILSLFPAIYETFILNEILALRRIGMDIYIFSLKNPGKMKCPKDAGKLMGHTFYSPFLFSKRLLLAQIYFLIVAFEDYFHSFFKIIISNYSNLTNLIKSLAIFPKSVYFAKVIQDLNIERLHAHSISIPTTSAMIISRLLKIPFSCTAHGSDIYQYPPPDIAERIKAANPFITISEFNKRYLLQHAQGISEDKIKVVHCGIDLKRFMPKEERNHNNTLRILNVARLEEVKGLVYLIEAFHILKEKGISFSCHFVGDGPQRQRLENLIYKYRLKENVSLEGEVLPEQVISFYEKADIFVLPSLREGIPVSVMEAMAMELSVIATDVFGMPELIEDWKEGILVPSRNKEAIAKAIEFMANNPFKRRDCGKTARKKIEKEFNICKTAHFLCDLFFSEREDSKNKLICNKDLIFERTCCNTL